jgi:hypothetical protein
MHKLLHMGSQLSSSAAQQYSTLQVLSLLLLGKMRASRGTGFWTLHAYDTTYAITAQQLSSTLHAQDTAYGIAVQQLSSSTSTAVQCMHKILQNGIAVQQAEQHRAAANASHQCSISAVQVHQYKAAASVIECIRGYIGDEVFH